MFQTRRPQKIHGRTKPTCWPAMLPLAFLQVGLMLGPAMARADQQILDDLIVDGSICVGLDCVNGETFGFDTLRLKENNLRIRFQDTSSSAAFPSNDWMIVINDSTNGGTNHFSIEDVNASSTPFRIDAGAGDSALHVSGRGVGLGTSSPDRALHMVVGDSPAVRLEQSSAQGWPPYVWDVGGNESFFFVRDGNANTMPLRIEPGADEATLVVSTGGNVSVAGTLTQGSSRSIKQAFEPVSEQQVLEKVAGLDVSRWQYREDESGARHIGPMAEDFYVAFGLGTDDKHIAPSDMAGVAVAAIQALRQRVVDQEGEIERLRSEGETVAARLARLESLLGDADVD